MKYFLLFVGIVIVGIIVFSNIDDKPSQPDDIMAYVMAVDYVKIVLKSPSTAKFANSWDSTITKTDLYTWTVTSYVDSQNGFGAMIRTNFTAVLKFSEDGAKCRLISLDI
jgi:hypothetical protein